MNNLADLEMSEPVSTPKATAMPPLKKYRTATVAEQLKAWKDIAFELNLHRTITMNQGAVLRCLERIDSWVQAHTDGNGERSDTKIKHNVNYAFWEKLSRNSEDGLKK